jgi:hypothetical protein
MQEWEENVVGRVGEKVLDVQGSEDLKLKGRWHGVAVSGNLATKTRASLTWPCFLVDRNASFACRYRLTDLPSRT